MATLSQLEYYFPNSSMLETSSHGTIYQTKEQIREHTGGGCSQRLSVSTTEPHALGHGKPSTNTTTRAATAGSHRNESPTTTGLHRKETINLASKTQHNKHNCPVVQKGFATDYHLYAKIKYGMANLDGYRFF
jgi:hypothetical protein